MRHFVTNLIHKRYKKTPLTKFVTFDPNVKNLLRDSLPLPLKRKTTKTEGDQNGRRPKWMTTKMDYDQNGRQPKRKTT